MQFLRGALSALMVAQLCGCASIVDGSTEAIYVSSAPIAGARCELSNARGSWTTVTPAAVTVDKSDSVLKAHCSKQGWSDATMYFASKLPTSAMIGALIPYVGLVSAAVDGSSGASGQYPDTIIVNLQLVNSANARSGARDPATAEEAATSK